MNETSPGMSPEASKLPPSGGGRLLFLTAETYEAIRALVSGGALVPDPKDFEVTSRAGLRFFRPRKEQELEGGTAAGTFNLRLLNVGVYSNEEGETNVTPQESAPFVIRFVNGLARHGWPAGTPGEIVANGIDPKVTTYDVLGRLVGAEGESGPGITLPEEETEEEE
jgi:hypothetical protein